MKDKIQDIVKELNDLNIIQETGMWMEDLPSTIWEKYFKDKSPIISGLDVDKHRWYETAIEVYQFDEKYLGVRVVTQMYSESSSIDDLYHTLEFFEMTPVVTTTYEKI